MISILINLERKIVSLNNYIAIKNFLPEDHSDRYSLYLYLEQFFSNPSKTIKVLDLGCGEGNSIDLFRSLSKNLTWYGVDIEDSPEVKQRLRESDLITSFDGINLPYPDNCFDLIYCNHVLEHVRYPDALIADALRVLKPNGKFVGLVSYLEPYHSYSIFNFTPYGIVRVFGDAGFKLVEMRPGVDASVLISRQLLNRSKALSLIWNRNFLHGMMGLVGKIFGLGHRERNFLKIQFSGHLVFLARRPT